jgi:hypothetical protein
MPDLTLSANIDGFLAETSALHIANGIVDGSAISSVDTNTRNLADSVGVTTLDWDNRILNDASGNPIAKWGEDNFTGVFGIAFAPDGMGNFYHLLNADGLKFFGAARYGQATIDYNGTTVIDIVNSNLISSAGNIDWYNGYLYNGGNITVDWVYGSLADANGTTVNWGTHELMDTAVVAMDWSGGSATFPRGATLTPTAVASLVGNEGTIAYVNDATTPVIGVAVTGGGAAKCLVCYNGTSWIVTALL